MGQRMSWTLTWIAAVRARGLGLGRISWSGKVGCVWGTSQTRQRSRTAWKGSSDGYGAFWFVAGLGSPEPWAGELVLWGQGQATEGFKQE